MQEQLGVVTGLGGHRHTGDLGDDLLHIADAHGAAGLALEPEGGAHLVEHVDGFVGQEAVVDVAVRQLRGGVDGRFGVAHLVVLLVARLQATQDAAGVVHRRLVDVDLLEAARQGPVLLDVVLVLLVGGRADAADGAVLQGRLEQVGGVHGAAAGGAGADDGVHLVDEQDGLVLLLDGGHHFLEPLFEVTAVLGAGHQGAEVEHVDFGVLEQVGHQFFRVRLGLLAGDRVLVDAQGQPFGHGGLAHARLAHQERVVLLAPAEHLHHPVEFLVAADERIDTALGGPAGEVDSELLQGIGRLFRSLLLLMLTGRRLAERLALQVFGQIVGDVLDHLEAADALAAEKIHGVRVLLGEDGDEHVAGVHLLLAAALHVTHRPLQHPVEGHGLRRFAFPALHHRHAGLEEALQPFLEILVVAAALVDDVAGQVVVQQAVEHVLHGDVLVTVALRFFNGLDQGQFQLFAQHDACPR